MVVMRLLIHPSLRMEYDRMSFGDKILFLVCISQTLQLSLSFSPLFTSLCSLSTSSLPLISLSSCLHTTISLSHLSLCQTISLSNLSFSIKLFLSPTSLSTKLFLSLTSLSPSNYFFLQSLSPSNYFFL